jgi:hypothetical protein
VSLEDRRAYYSSLQAVPLQVNQFVQSIGDVAKSHCILRSLLGAEIGSREEQIHEAYAKTFDWIFDGDNDGTNQEHHTAVNAARAHFEQWLRTSSEVFWINGKAGSGKSTLMKYLADHAKTEEILSQWAGDESLVIAKHFFWNSGSVIQKSHVGLMQNLMLQLLQQCPELIPFASKQRWEADQSQDLVDREHPWTRQELATALTNIMARGQLTSRFCLFIDGLDEYADEGAGEHHELIEYLDMLARSDQVKLCVSSRPWTVFKDRYEGREDLTLVLQDLTSRDMETYVEGILINDERFRRLLLREPEALRLAFEIRAKAEGVFLWVFLVVRSLLKGLSEHDDTAELGRRLSAIPNDLNQYFLKIFENIDLVYRREAMRAFQLSTVAMPLPLLAFKYISKEALSSQYAFEMTIAELDTSNDKAIDNVNKWCRDLLEVLIHLNSLGKVEEMVCFLHRTVKDFLLTREMQTHFKEYLVCQSSPLQAMCMMYLAQTRMLAGYQNEVDYIAFDNDAMELMRWALHCEKTEGEPPTKILDQFDQLTGRLDLTPAEKPRTALQYAVMQGLCSYVNRCLDRDPLLKEDLLWFVAPLHKVSSRLEFSDMSAMFSLLMWKGVDPNQACPDGYRRFGYGVQTPAPPGKTTWEVFLAAYYNGSIESQRGGTLYHFAELWIRYGADINTTITVAGRRLDVRTCLLTATRQREGRPYGDCEREVDVWLAAARARRSGKSLVSSPEPLKRPSFRAKLKRLLA